MLAKSVTEFAFKRELYKNLINLQSQCFQADLTLDQLNGIVYSEIDGLTQNFILGGDTKTLGDDIDDIWGEIESRRTDSGLYGLPSKYNCFNRYFTFERGELIVVQAKYKEGKSVLLMNEAVHKLKNGIPTLVIDTEMQTRLYVERLLSHLSGVEVKKIKSGKLSQEEEIKLTESREWIN